MNTTLTGPYPRVIGIHVTLPQGSHWKTEGVESRMLQSLIVGRLVQAGLHNIEDSEKRQSAVFSGQFIAFLPVTDFSPALKSVAEVLSSVGLLEVSQLAWLDRQEGIWRNERPLPESVPFAERIADFAAFTVACIAQLSGPNSPQAAEMSRKSDQLN